MQQEKRRRVSRAGLLLTMEHKQSFILIAPSSNFGGPVLYLSYESHNDVRDAERDFQTEDAQIEPEEKPVVNWIRNAVAQARRLPAAIKIPRLRFRRGADRAGR